MNNDGYKYGRYVDLNQESRWATIDEIKNAGTYIDLSMSDYPTAGLPLISDGKEAYVDGKEAEIISVAGTFCAVELGAGEHEIEFVFTPEGMYVGVVVSLMGVAAFTAAVILNRKRIKKNKTTYIEK